MLGEGKELIFSEGKKINVRRRLGIDFIRSLLTGNE